MIVIPDPLPRGVYCSGFYFPGRRVSVAAVTSANECLHRLIVGTRAELEAAVISLAASLDDADPRVGSPPRRPPLVSTLHAANLYLLR